VDCKSYVITVTRQRAFTGSAHTKRLEAFNGE
jgi:hypothetical protein